MDSGSFVAPVDLPSSVRWPYGGMRDVPLAFNLELPHPKPGENQSEWGYPVTPARSIRPRARACPIETPGIASNNPSIANHAQCIGT